MNYNHTEKTVSSKQVSGGKQLKAYLDKITHHDGKTQAALLAVCRRL